MNKNTNEVGLTPEETKYIDLVLEPRVKNKDGQLAYGIATSWAYIAAYNEGRAENGHNVADFKEKGDKIAKSYEKLDKWLAEQIYGDKDKTKEVERLKEKFAVANNRWDAQKHRTGFADFEACQKCVEQADEVDYEKGKYGFETFANFYKWYQKQPAKNGEKHCVYCGTTETTLKQLFKEKANESERFKPLYSKKRSFTATLQIDRKNSDEGYNDSNCVLACTFCNNAKSDMIRERDISFFEKHFGEFVRKLYEYLLKGK